MSKNFYEAYQHICHLLSGVTRLDVRLLDENSVPQVLLIGNPLPELIQSLAYEESIRHQVLKTESSTSYLYEVNRFELGSLIIGLWDREQYRGYIALGPFISQVVDHGFISKVIAQHGFFISDRPSLQDYYQSLQFIGSNEIKLLGEMLARLAFQPESKISMCTFTPPSEMDKNDSSRREEYVEELLLRKKAIEKRYEEEKYLIKLISSGNMEKLEGMMKRAKGWVDLTDRIPESPQRSIKNLLFVMNTICRLAAEQGGVHPIYLHSISERYAILIERTERLPLLNQLIPEMLREYCLLVREHAFQGSSEIIRQARMMIQMHLDQPVTLTWLADALHISEGYLSKLFKQEVGDGFVNYVNKQRIEEAKHYLMQGSLSVTEVALLVGYSDLNYFSRVFKKVTGLPPSYFRNTASVSSRILT